jgi:hypothetical protein
MKVSNYKRWYDKNKPAAREYKRLKMRELRAKSPDKYRAHSRACHKALKDKVFDVFGRECEACGFDDERALTLDHVKNNGAQERLELGERGVYRRALRKEFYMEYRTLCMNCQFIKRIEAKRQNQHG